MKKQDKIRVKVVNGRLVPDAQLEERVVNGARMFSQAPYGYHVRLWAVCRECGVEHVHTNPVSTNGTFPTLREDDTRRTAYCTPCGKAATEKKRAAERAFRGLS